VDRNPIAASSQGSSALPTLLLRDRLTPSDASLAVVHGLGDQEDHHEAIIFST
jgi:hypothetical protein